MIEPLACVIRGQRMIGVKKDHTVLVPGCGVSGILNIILAKRTGARVLATDVDPIRLENAATFGAEVHDARKLPEFKANRIIMCTGAFPAFEQAFRNLDRGGTLLLFAIPDKNITLPTLDFWRNEFTVTSSYGAAPEDIIEAIRLMQTVDLKPFITLSLPLEHIQEGFKRASQGGATYKVVITDS
jgi:L-iditol 2-dehydrogenase